MTEKSKIPQTIDKLFPRESKVKLENLDHEFTVGKVTLAVDAWIKQEFGSPEAAAVLLEGGDPEAIIKLFYKLLSFEDKTFVKNIKVEQEMDDEGNVVEVTNQVQKLLNICSVNDVKAIFISLVKSRGISLPENFGEEKKPKPKGKQK